MTRAGIEVPGIGTVSSGDQVGRERPGLAEDHGSLAVRGLRALFQRVRERRVGLGHDERDRVGDLVRRLVPARERLPRVHGLELRERVRRAAGLETVETDRARVEIVREIDREPVAPRREGRLRSRGDDPLGACGGDGQRNRGSALLRTHRRATQRDVLGVEVKRRHGPLHLDGDLDRALVAGVTRIEIEADRLRAGDHVLTQPRDRLGGGRGGRGEGNEEGGDREHHFTGW